MKSVYAKSIIKPHYGEVFVQAINEGFLTSLIAFIGEIRRAKLNLKKRALIAQSEDARVDIREFSELEKVIIASNVNEGIENGEVYLTYDAKRLQNNLSKYVVTNRSFQKILWGDLDTRQMRTLLEKCS